MFTTLREDREKDSLTRDHGRLEKKCIWGKREEQKAGTFIKSRSGSLRGKMNCRGTTLSRIELTLAFCLK